MIGDGGHAGLDHLDQAEQHPPVDILGGQVALHGPDELVEPAIHRHILRNAAKEHHRRVGVRVDQPRRRQQPIRRHDGTHVQSLRRLRRPDRSDAIALHVDVVIGQRGVRAVIAAHEDRTVVDEEVDWHLALSNHGCN